MTRTWVSLWFCCWILGLTARAQSRPDFRGAWVLDRNASESLEPLLEAQGVPVLERRVYARLNVTLKVEQNSQRVKIVFITPLASDVEDLPTDGQVGERDVPFLGTVRFQSTWSEDGKILITRSEAHQGTVTATVRRYLDENKRFVHATTVVGADGRTFSARRVFRKQA